MIAPRPVVVLGATGSIGLQTLAVAERLGMPVVGLAARNPGPLADLALAHPHARVVATGGSREERERLEEVAGRRAGFGGDAMLDLARTPGAIVVNAVVGAAGLRASVAALEAGNRLALANKESLVAGGEVVLAARDRGAGELVPVDSEHSALFQLLQGRPPHELTGLVLTASGGPFRGRRREDLAEATPEDALAHPTWDMGRRISIDSATLANKGLEVIEAHHLFGFAYDAIRVVVHPQSVVHSMVELADGSLLAHLGQTDMRIPIQYALTEPQRASSPADPFELFGRTLTFEPPDPETFPALRLAYEAGRQGGAAPAIFNAADEVAVQAFLDHRLGFLGISEVIERTLAAFDPPPPGTVEDVLAVDREARALATGFIAGAC